MKWSMAMHHAKCLFCERGDKTKHRIIAENEHAYVRWDNFPVSDGHIEVVPIRHVVSFFDLTEAEVLSMYALLKVARRTVIELYPIINRVPDGYTIGLNEGEAAGRTVHHVHMHLIPRYWGDVPNPRGGIRNIIPDKGGYKE